MSTSTMKALKQLAPGASVSFLLDELQLALQVAGPRLVELDLMDLEAAMSACLDSSEFVDLQLEHQRLLVAEPASALDAALAEELSDRASAATLECEKDLWLFIAGVEWAWPPVARPAA